MQANELFDRITVQMIADIEAGTERWRMPWHCLADLGTPVNADGRGYQIRCFCLGPLRSTVGTRESGRLFKVGDAKARSYDAESVALT